MKRQPFRVLHKGFFIVVSGLAIELLALIATGTLNYLIYQEQLTISGHRDKAVAAARLMLADLDAGLAIMRAWRQKNLAALDSVDEALNRADAHVKEIIAVNQRSGQAPSQFQQRSLACQARAAQLFRQIQKATAQGLTMESLQTVITLQDELSMLMRRTFEDMQQYAENGRQEMARTQEFLEKLTSMLEAALILSVLLNVGWAVMVFRYFGKEFIDRLERLHNKLTSTNFPQETADNGTDEIAEVDRSFHQMWQELTLAAELERSLFENSADIICVLDENLACQRINPAVETVWGLAPQALSGTHVLDLLPDEARSIARQALLSSRQGNPSINFEVTMNRPDGTSFRALWSAYWSAEQQSWFCLVQDVSEQFELSRLRQQFLDMIIEDLQKPLESMRLAFRRLELTNGEPLPQKVADRTDRLLGTLDRLSVMLAELVKAEEIYQCNIRTEPLALRAVIDAAIDDVQELCNRKSIKIQVSCSVEGLVELDRSKIIRVLVNLISNAVKFSPPGSTISVIARECAVDSVQITVADQGRGIPSEVLSRLFAPFQQSEAADGSRDKGTGLGLAICKKFVEMHGGTIGADSQEGQGSSFRFTLPRRQTDVEPSPALLPALQQPTGALAVCRAELPALPEQSPAALDRLGLRKIRVLMLLPTLICQCVFLLCLSAVMAEGRNLLANENEARELTMRAVQLCASYCDARMVVSTPHSGEDDIREAMNKLSTSRRDFIELARSKGANPKRIDGIERLTNATEPLAYNILNKIIEERPLQPHQATVANADHLLAIAGKVNQRMLPIINEYQQKQMVSRHRWYGSMVNLFAFLACWSLVDCIIAVMLSKLFSNSIGGRLKIIAENTARFASDEQLLPPVSGSDEIARMDRSFRDMAAQLKEAREKEKAFLDNSRDLIGTIDRNLVFLALNRVSSEYLGLPARRICGTNLLDTVIEQQQQSVREKLSAEVSRLRIEMQHVPTMIDLSWSFNWSDSEQRFFFVARNITNQKALERLRQELLTVAGHDLRSPISMIAGACEIMQAGALGNLSPQAVRSLEQVSSRVYQVNDLITDLLDLEKIRAGKMPRVSTVSARDIMQITISLLSETMIEADCQGTAHDAYITCDAERLPLSLSAVISEVAVTAKHTTLRGTTSDSAFCLSVNGEMTKLEQVDALKARLSQASFLLSPGAQETRLKLPLAKEVISWHTGRMEILQNGHSLIVTILLPLCNPPATVFSRYEDARSG